MAYDHNVKLIPIGTKFGRWTVLGEQIWVELTGAKRKGISKVPCVCECGTLRLIVPGALRHKSTTSCGCLKLEKFIARKCRRTHGLSEHPIYDAWCGMRTRCLNPDSDSYKNYGGRGVKICEEWMDFMAFYNWSLPEWRPSLSIDRINNNGNYEPGNCRWTTAKIQIANRRCSIWITYNGCRYLLSEFVKLTRATAKFVSELAKINPDGEFIISELRKAGRQCLVPDAITNSSALV